MYKTGYFAVTADILHIGHIIAIRNCKKHCDKLIVGVMSDEYIRAYKNRDPIMPYHERADIVQALRYVWGVVRQDKYDMTDMLLKVDPDIVFDSEQHDRNYCGKPVIKIPYYNGTSSTKIIKRCYEIFSDSLRTS